MSPEYYWVRVFELPIKSSKEVLNILPSLFEEFIDISKHKFYAKKLSENKYLSIAYDEQNILNSIKDKGITLSQIDDICFSQIEFESVCDKDTQNCIKVDDICLSYIDGILVQIPIALKTIASNNINLQDIKLSKNKIYINSASKYLNTKTTYILSLIIFIFSVAIASKAIFNKQISNNIPNNIEIIKQKTNMPQSTIQANSIIKKLEKNYKNQLKIRESLKYILLSHKSLKSQIVSIEFFNNTIYIKYKNITKKRVLNYLNKKFKINKSYKNGDILTIEVNIWKK